MHDVCGSLIMRCKCRVSNTTNTQIHGKGRKEVGEFGKKGQKRRVKTKTTAKRKNNSGQVSRRPEYHPSIHCLNQLDSENRPTGPTQLRQIPVQEIQQSTAQQQQTTKYPTDTGIICIVVTTTPETPPTHPSPHGH